MKMMAVGEPAPWFTAPTLDGNARFSFETTAGRPILLMMAGSLGWPACAQALAKVRAHRPLFDDVRASFFGVSIDPADVSARRIAKEIPGFRWFLDHDRRISTLFGVAHDDQGAVRYEPHFLLLDHRLRVAGVFRIADADAALAAFRDLAARGCEVRHAPVLIVPRVLEPEVCRHLIGLYDRHGGQQSGFMREEDGRTVGILDHSFKRRADHIIADEALQKALSMRLSTRLLPEIRRAYAFAVTRIERWLVACYDGEGGGYFKPHRDNRTGGTAHRRFACTINLNTEEYDGGELRFPEYGDTRYRAPTGGAVIFSCSLLHEAMPVTRGRRYAFLPFLYDEEAAEIRERNKHLIVDHTPAVAMPAVAAG